MFIIEKNVPILPAIKDSKKNLELKNALNSLELNESFLMPIGNSTRKIVYNIIANTAKVIPNRKYTMRTIPNEGIRVWRIA